MTAEEAVLHPDKYEVLYCGPVPGLDRNGREVTCNIDNIVSIHDAIAMARYCENGSGFIKDSTDLELLQTFVSVHWAQIQERK